MLVFFRLYFIERNKTSSNFQEHALRLYVFNLEKNVENIQKIMQTAAFFHKIVLYYVLKSSV